MIAVFKKILISFSNLISYKFVYLPRSAMDILIPLLPLAFSSQGYGINQ